MSNQNGFQPFGPNFDEIMAEMGKMKESGANNTQIRAFLEEKGWTGIKFDTDDIGINPGVPPQLYQAEEELLPTGQLRDELLDMIMEPVNTDTRIRAMLNPINTIGRMNIGRLYEVCVNQIVKETQERINKGPLKDMVGICGMTVNESRYKIFHVVAPTFRAKNRVKAYSGYLDTIMTAASETLVELYKQGE